MSHLSIKPLLLTATSAHGTEIMKKKAARSAITDALGEERKKPKAHSGQEKNRKQKRVALPLNKYERLAMSAADAESQGLEKLWVLAAQKPPLHNQILCGADAVVWRERSAMRTADEETHRHERNSMATRVRILEHDATVLAKQLHWHESLRDTTQSLARANLLQHQGLPSWIVLDGMKIGEAISDRKIPAAHASKASRTRQAEGKGG